MPAWTGKTLNKVEIGSMIARGGMAEVYLGEHSTLNRKVAIKIMRDHVDSDPDAMSRFQREARVIAGMHHQNIIQVYDYDVIEGQPCLIMEYVPGASLATYLRALHKRNEKLPLDMVAKIIKILAGAIDYAHNQHVVHRDIKPANVLLRSATGPIDENLPLPMDVEPVLTDFGLVRLLDSSIQTSTGTVSGTPAYMSPEQARGDSVNERTDIYSFGVMVYEMLAGTVPFESESSFGVLMKHLNDPPPPIFGISSDLQFVIDRALAKDAALRYESATAFADEFISVFNGQTISSDTSHFLKLARQTTFSRQKQSTFGLNRNLAILAVAILVGFAYSIYRAFIAPQFDENRPVGQVAYSDFNGSMDKVNLSITNLPIPKAGTHYEAWYLAQGGEARRNIGEISMSASGQGQLVFIEPNEENILGLFDQIEVSIEPDNDPNPNESSGEIVASSVFPPFALVHVRHLVDKFAAAPDQTALIQGLWFGADEIAISTQSLQQAYENGDEELVRLHTEEIINQLVGSANTDLYIDWNEDGEINDPGDGYGLLENGEPGYSDQGYIPQAISHATFAAQAIDSTEDINTQSQYIIISLKNMEGWSEQLLARSRELQNMPFGSNMGPLVAEIVKLSSQIVSGTDSNGNERIEPIVGEGGAGTAYEHAYIMAQMPLLRGFHRVPPPANPINQ